MIVVYNKDTKQFVGVATRVFDNGRWREPTLEELYPNADRTKLGYLYVEDSPKYALRPDSWQFKLDENGVTVELTSSVETISVTVSASAEGVKEGSLSFEFVPPEE